ncbi:MAG: glycosyltransferase [Cyanobium sp.]
MFKISDPVLIPFSVPWQRGTAVVVTVLAIRYVPWRMGNTLNLDNPQAACLSVVLLMAEFLLLGHGFLLMWLSALGGADSRGEIEAAATRLEADRLTCPGDLSTVAVLVPTFGEPQELVLRCLRGALALDYPKLEVWLLDDSHRSELHNLCAQMGCRYLARGDRRHAKAGNLNHALLHVTAELIAVLDADVVPLANFLSRTVGLFRDPLVGFVQTPQSYMGADPMMRNLRLERWLMPDEESFYRWIEPSRDRLSAVVCAGTSFVMRRSALCAVGGFETATTSEDLATGIRMVAAGYRGLYVAEKLSAGMAPLTMAAMVVQRCRWASGTLQVLRTGANPLRIPGLKPLQRLAYMEGILHWLLVFPFLILVAAPLLIAQAHLSPLRLSSSGLWDVALPFYLSQILLIRWYSQHARSALMPELYRWVLAFPMAKTVWAVLWGRPTSFHVTPKGGGIARGVGANRSLLWPLLGFLCLQLLAGVQLMLSPTSMILAGVGLAWALLNGLMILVAIRSCWDRPREDAIPWLAPQLDGVLHMGAGSDGVPVRVTAISEAGCEVLLRPGALAERVDAHGQGMRGPWHVTLGHPLLAIDWPVKLECVSRGGRRKETRQLGMSWADLNAHQRDQLETYLYRRPGLWPSIKAPWDLVALPKVAGLLMRRVGAEGWFQRSLMPIR